MTEHKNFGQNNDTNSEHIFLFEFYLDYFAWCNLPINFILRQSVFIFTITTSVGNKRFCVPGCDTWLISRLIEKIHLLKLWNSTWTSIGKIMLNGRPKRIVNTLIPIIFLLHFFSAFNFFEIKNQVMFHWLCLARIPGKGRSFIY